MRRLPWFLLLLLLTACSPSKPKTHSLREQFEALAKESSMLEISDILYQRTSHYIDGHQVEDLPDYAQFLSRIISLNKDRDALVPLLKHPDPKVRTLAAAALASRDDPSVLPAIAKLAGDKAITFSRMHGSSSEAGHPERERKLKTGVTVDENVTAILEFYLRPANYFDFNSPEKIREEAQDYAEMFKGKTYSVSWFQYRIERTLDQDYTSLSARKKQDGIRNEINQLPQPDRAWAALYLWQENPYFHLHSDAELLDLLRQLGPIAIMKVINTSKTHCQDPILSRWNLSHTPSSAEFILTRADKLLRPEDAINLMLIGSRRETSADFNEETLERFGNSFTTSPPCWYIGAALLRPDKAVTILRGAYDQYAECPYSEGNDKLGVALWKAAGESQSSFLLDKYFDPSPKAKEDLNDGWRAKFVEELSKIKQPSGNLLISSIIRDKRFDEFPMNRNLAGALLGAAYAMSSNPTSHWTEYEFTVIFNLMDGSPSHSAHKRSLIQKMRALTPLPPK